MLGTREVMMFMVKGAVSACSVYFVLLEYELEMVETEEKTRTNIPVSNIMFSISSDSSTSMRHGKRAWTFTAASAATMTFRTFTSRSQYGGSPSLSSSLSRT